MDNSEPETAHPTGFLGGIGVYMAKVTQNYQQVQFNFHITLNLECKIPFYSPSPQLNKILPQIRLSQDWKVSPDLAVGCSVGQDVNVLSGQ